MGGVMVGLLVGGIEATEGAGEGERILEIVFQKEDLLFCVGLLVLFPVLGGAVLGGAEAGTGGVEEGRGSKSGSARLRDSAIARSS
eukprot:scaffold1105_cov184-Ochromonas_danica.AAC.5